MGTDVVGVTGATPKYDRPPVTEVAVGIEFVPVPELGVVELVRLHRLWEDKYPKIVTQPALPPSVAPGGVMMTGFGLRIGGEPGPVRLWMLTPDEHMLLQLQNDRLILNWRRLNGDQYPSYAALRTQFMERWEEFSLAVSRIGQLRPTTADVTFVNSIVLPGSPAEPQLAFRAIAKPSLPGKVTQSRWQFLSELKDRDGHKGQLVVSAEPIPGPQDVVQLTVVSRFSLGGEGMDPETILRALDDAHDAGVASFTELTTPNMHKEWGRTA